LLEVVIRETLVHKVLRVLLDLQVEQDLQVHRVLLVLKVLKDYKVHKHTLVHLPLQVG
tara:strand:- start:746 stop:919 length:174 start_codon:yes stop_codon:yes gene_type:complete